MSLNTILAYCHNAQPQWLHLLEEMVNTDSGSRDQAGLEAMCQLLKQRWQNLGFETKVLATDTGPQLVSKRQSNNPDAPTVLLIGHVDTVFDRGTVGQRPFAIRNGRAYGPGVADMKGGLVAMLGVVEALQAVGSLDAASFVVVNNCDEEISSECSRAIIEGYCEGTRAALVFEPGRPNGCIVTARKGVQAHFLEVTGKAAHAGVNPQAGASAIEALCRKVVALHALNDYEAGLTVNVGLINGGTRPNVVAQRATADIDVRVPSARLAEQVKQSIQAIVAREEVPGTQACVTLLSERGPMVQSERSTSILSRFQNVAESLGFALKATATGGGSDGNFTAAKGIPTLDGLGPVGGGFHSDQEYLEVESLPLRVTLVAGGILQLSKPSA